MERVNCSKCGADNTTKVKYCTSCGYELPKITTDKLSNDVPQNKLSKPINKKKYIGIIGGVLFFFLTYYGTQQLFFKFGTIDKNMMSVANELNKSCPFMVDSETRLDNTIALPDKVFQYNYTLVNVDKSQADTMNMKNYLEQNIINQFKTNPQLRYQREHKWTMIFMYKDKHELYLLMVKLTPDKYAE